MENFDRIAKTADAMRLDHAQFEAWAKLHRYDLTRCSHEPYAAYRSDLTNAALAGWRGGNGEAVQPDHYQQLLGVAYVVLGCLVANGVDIPERFLDAFSDPDSVENPLELLPCDFSPAQAVRAAVGAAEPVAWSVYNGVCLDQIFMLRESADKYAANMQKSHDLSGSLAAFVVKPLYAAPQG